MSVWFSDVCQGVNCGQNKKCKVRRGLPRCVCAPDCSSQRDRPRGALCGIDQKTYRNHCSLLKENCRSSAKVWVDYMGSCQCKYSSVT